ncbi:MULTISPECIES: DUF2845 domain-containing protein [Pseudomonas]|uniref:DUF2845 domain-containing protein n=1 Tax=Pseudomonas phytophila TaxID=2867264 RepID=A0ABY6FG95_9PSED|nr:MULTISPECIES: DUF2845 domain-containing protein [Pseudomonas]MCD5988788.1 DUF2845 domain-containing protein [Pseudomonas quasicaspiana]MDU8357897.1 DUF2845 domain-containing protein [Pseudomonas syringae group sp. J309-1]UXZ96684.1 DUF2845 domain-containing protein [Pseudomonas phytophila]
MGIRSLLVALALLSGSAHASMRCNSALIDEGDLAVEVLRKCGPPAERQITPPALAANGQLIHGAVTVETWVYGPENGMYRNLRFIDGRLVQIKSSK